jgi:hypothetical protein
LVASCSARADRGFVRPSGLRRRAARREDTASRSARVIDELFMYKRPHPTPETCHAPSPWGTNGVSAVFVREFPGPRSVWVLRRGRHRDLGTGPVSGPRAWSASRPVGVHPAYRRTLWFVRRRVRPSQRSGASRASKLGGASLRSTPQFILRMTPAWTKGITTELAIKRALATVKLTGAHADRVDGGKAHRCSRPASRQIRGSAALEGEPDPVSVLAQRLSVFIRLLGSSGHRVESAW